MNFLKALAALEIVSLLVITSACTDDDTYHPSAPAQAAPDPIPVVLCQQPDHVRNWSAGSWDFVTQQWHCFGRREEWITITYSRPPGCDWRLEAVDVREGRRCEQ